MPLKVLDATHGGDTRSDHKRSDHDSSAHGDEQAQVAGNLKGVKKVIGVHCGKGGVGKTFVAVNLAFALAAHGRKVGLLDGDIDCPNVIRFLNIDAELGGTPEGRIVPIEHNGVKIVSTHLLAQSPDEPMIIRGPIKHQVIAELLSRVEWGELDYLIIDLPPGTSDVPMSSMLLGRMEGIVVVTTPQKEALHDARKSILMARKLDVPVLGVLENMSGGAFGAGGGKLLAQEMGVAYLGAIPLSSRIAKLNAAGKIAFLAGFDQAELFAALGETLKKKGWRTAFHG